LATKVFLLTDYKKMLLLKKDRKIKKVYYKYLFRH
jgi:hypothetical protein